MNRETQVYLESRFAILASTICSYADQWPMAGVWLLWATVTTVLWIKESRK